MRMQKWRIIVFLCVCARDCVSTFCLSRLFTSLMPILAWSLACRENMRKWGENIREISHWKRENNRRNSLTDKTRVHSQRELRKKVFTHGYIQICKLSSLQDLPLSSLCLRWPHCPSVCQRWKRHHQTEGKKLISKYTKNQYKSASPAHIKKKKKFHLHCEKPLICLITAYKTNITQSQRRVNVKTVITQNYMKL